MGTSAVSTVLVSGSFASSSSSVSEPCCCFCCCSARCTAQAFFTSTRLQTHLLTGLASITTRCTLLIRGLYSDASAIRTPALLQELFRLHDSPFSPSLSVDTILSKRMTVDIAVTVSDSKYNCSGVNANCTGIVMMKHTGSPLCRTGSNCVRLHGPQCITVDSSPVL